MVNIQGDEPLIDPVIIDGIVLALQVCYWLLKPGILVLRNEVILHCLLSYMCSKFVLTKDLLRSILSEPGTHAVVLIVQRSPDAVYSTAVTELKPDDTCNPNRVKCIVDKNGYAMYFSRALLPSNLYVVYMIFNLLPGSNSVVSIQCGMYLLKSVSPPDS